MKVVTRRVSTVAIATLLAAPMGAGIASAEVVDPGTDPGTEITDPGDGGETTDPGDGGETTDPGDGGETTDPGDGGETTDPGDGGETTDPGDGGETTDPGDGGETTDPGDGGEGTDPGDGGEGTDPGDEVIVGDFVDIETAFDYISLLTWAPSGNYSTTLTGLTAAGVLPDSAGYTADIAVTWSYTLNGGAAVDFVPVDGAFTVTGLVEGENALVVTATYTPATDTEDLVSALAATSLVHSAPVTVTVQTMAETITDLQADSLPEYTINQGETGTFVAREGFFSAGETITVTLVPVGGGDPITMGTGVAAADGSFSYDLSVPTDLPSGDYYLVAEGAASGTLGYALLHVGAGSINDNNGDNTVGDTTNTTSTDTVDTISQLATTGSNPATGLLVGTLATLAGAGTVFGVRRFTLGRADV